MRISATKFISLLFFIFSAFYLYTAHQIVVFTFDENAPFNARTFPIYLGWAGIFLSSLRIILPEKITTEVNHKHLDYKSIILLILVSVSLWCGNSKNWILFINVFIFNNLILFFRGEEMDLDVFTFISFCSFIYVFTTWSA